MNSISSQFPQSLVSCTSNRLDGTGGGVVLSFFLVVVAGGGAILDQKSSSLNRSGEGDFLASNLRGVDDFVDIRGGDGGSKSSQVSSSQPEEIGGSLVFCLCLSKSYKQY